jgi:type IV fimbrial biogenesis protein FimT
MSKLLMMLARRASRCVAPARARQAGVTLIELLVVVSIAAILAAMAAPSFRSFINSTRQSSAAMQLVSDLNLARSEAIKRNAHILVCARNAAGTDCVGSTNWQVGWLVCLEGGAANQCAAGTASTPNPIIVRPALDSALTLVYVNPTTISATNVRFNANSSQGSDGAANTLTLGGTWSDAVSRVITVATTGNISKQ